MDVIRSALCCTNSDVTHTLPRVHFYLTAGRYKLRPLDVSKNEIFSLKVQFVRYDIVKQLHSNET